MSESKSAIAFNETISYSFDSNLATAGPSGNAHLYLATSIREARYLYFFEGKVLEASAYARVDLLPEAELLALK